MLTGYIHHYPDYTRQDDGFGNLLLTPSDMFEFNFDNYNLPEDYHE